MSGVILIAGAGFLGREVLRQALKNGEHVIAISRHQEELSFSFQGQSYTELIQAVDLTVKADVVQFATSLTEPLKGIVFCASSGRSGLEAYQRIFLTGIENLIVQFPTTPLVLTSSTSVYHQCEGEYVDEESATEPIRETSQVLLDSENQVLSHGGIVARLGGLYGAGRSHYVQRLLGGEALIEQGRWVNAIHCVDAAKALLHLLDGFDHHAGKVFNVCAPESQTQEELYRSLAKHFGLAVPPFSSPSLNNKGHRQRSRKRAWTNKKVSSKKLEATGWVAQYPRVIDAVQEGAC